MRSSVIAALTAALVMGAAHAAETGAETLAAEARGTAPAVFRDCPRCPAMIAAPAGRFIMGAAPGEAWADEQEEGPRRAVSLPAFALSRSEITFAEWDACLADGFCRGHAPDDAGWGRGARPAINVSREDAEAFAAWLNAKLDGDPYRLPSEAEWEYAARAGTEGPFWFGPRIEPELANYDTRTGYGGGAKAEPLRRTAPVGAYPPNPWGFTDMTGNVWEWTADCWHWNYSRAPDDGAPSAYGDCAEAPLRGGAWDERPHHLRAANRYYLPVDRRRRDVGFRIARDLTPERPVPARSRGEDSRD